MKICIPFYVSIVLHMHLTPVICILQETNFLINNLLVHFDHYCAAMKPSAPVFSDQSIIDLFLIFGFLNKLVQESKHLNLMY